MERIYQNPSELMSVITPVAWENAAKFLMSPDEFKRNTPSRQTGISMEEEMKYRTQAATLVYDAAQKLLLPQIVVNNCTTALHRHYTVKPFVKWTERHHCSCNKRSEYWPLTFFDALQCCAILFLAAKFEEKVRKSEHVRKCLIFLYFNKDKMGSMKECACGFHQNPTEFCERMTDELHELEQEALRVMGFRLEVAHPHVEMMQLLRLTDTKHELGQTAYFLTSTCNQVTPFCLFYSPEHIAAVCLYTTLKWSGFEIPKSAEGKLWTEYLKAPMSEETLAQRSADLVKYVNRMPPGCKAKLFKWRQQSKVGPESRPSGNLDPSRAIMANPEINGGQSGPSTSGQSNPMLVSNASEKVLKRMSLSDYHHRNHGSTHGSRGSHPSTPQTAPRSDSALTPVDRQGLRDKDRQAQTHQHGFHRSSGSSKSGSLGPSSKEGSRSNNSHGLNPHAAAQHRPSGSNGQKHSKEEDYHRSGHTHGSGVVPAGPPQSQPKRSRVDEMLSGAETVSVGPHSSGNRSSMGQPSSHPSTHTSGYSAGHPSSQSAHFTGHPSGHSANPSKGPDGFSFHHNSKSGLPQGQERSRDPAYMPRDQNLASRSHHSSSTQRPSSSTSSAQQVPMGAIRTKHRPSSESNRHHPYASSGSAARHEAQSQRQSAAWPSGDSHMTAGGSPMEVTKTSPRDIELGTLPSNTFHSSQNMPPSLPSHHSSRR